MNKPSIPQGTRDFSPEVVSKRQYIFQTLKGIFELYGYLPIETPAMEQLTTLMGKYGDEGDRLIFKIMNNGLHESKPEKKAAMANDFNRLLEKSLALPSLTERALRYDLTIPFARYVVMNQNDIAFPFKRYQMQPVWRADRPQRGRYREFWQCDCDVVGSTSLINEAELLCIYAQAFTALNIPQVTIKINSRKLLSGMAAYCGHADKMMGITVAIDKLDKIGWEGVVKELNQLGIDEHGFEKLKQIISIKGSNEELIEQLTSLLQSNEEAMHGIEELTNTLRYYKNLASNWNAQVVVDTSLARGLNYYTGIIMEVTTDAVKMGSIGGGGRYDDLTGLFGLKNMSGVGVSFGIDRIYDVMEELDLFPKAAMQQSKILLLNLGAAQEKFTLHVLTQLRAANIAAEVYPDTVKMDKQLKYANKRGFEYVGFIGEDEMKNEQVSLKNFSTGIQETVNIEQLILQLQKA